MMACRDTAPTKYHRRPHHGRPIWHKSALTKLGGGIPGATGAGTSCNGVAAPLLVANRYTRCRPLATLPLDGTKRWCPTSARFLVRNLHSRRERCEISRV